MAGAGCRRRHRRLEIWIVAPLGVGTEEPRHFSHGRTLWRDLGTSRSTPRGTLGSTLRRRLNSAVCGRYFHLATGYTIGYTTHTIIYCHCQLTNATKKALQTLQAAITICRGRILLPRAAVMGWFARRALTKTPVLE